VKEYQLLARRGRLLETGIRLSRLVGVGTEFESLRDYLPDDEFRRINWKATARRGKPISCQYQVDRSQNLIIMLERRLDNMVYRKHFAPSRKAARQLVLHGHVQVNGKTGRPAWLVEMEVKRKSDKQDIKAPAGCALGGVMFFSVLNGGGQG
jgi:hypothetical protein